MVNKDTGFKKGNKSLLAWHPWVPSCEWGLVDGYTLPGSTFGTIPRHWNHGCSTLMEVWLE